MSLRRMRVTASFLVLVALGVALLNHPSSSPRHRAEVRASPSPGAPTATHCMCWNFGAGVPSDWVALVRTSAKAGVTLVTTDRTVRYQLESGPLQLATGQHQVRLTLRVLRGAILISVLDLRAQRFVVTQAYAASSFASRQLETVAFSFHAPVGNMAAVVLSNGAAPQRSTWELQRISVS